MGLSCARLSIGKDSSIVALKDVCDNRRRTFYVDVSLPSFVTVRHIKSELLRIITLLLVHVDLTAFVNDVDNLGVAL